LAVLEEQLYAQPRYLTPRQVAEILGVSAVTIRHCSLNGKWSSLPHMVGNAVIFFTDIIKFA